MRLYDKGQGWQLYQGDMLDMLEVIEKNTIDSIVTDPPYELNFMGKKWDNGGISFKADTWQKCLEVLKPGGYLLAFGGARTFHRIATAIEDAGFEIRDTIMWLYGSGFPKSLNIGLAIDKKNGVDNRKGNIKSNRHASTSDVYGLGLKKDYEERIALNKWNGWGSCLKPSFEPIIVARKPFKGSLTDNVIKNGVGGLNIDECRVETEDRYFYKNGPKGNTWSIGKEPDGQINETICNHPLGRFPANTILTYDEEDYDEVYGGFPETLSKKSIVSNTKSIWGNGNDDERVVGYEDRGSAARYFYCAKASKKDRDEGLDTFCQGTVNYGRKTPIDNSFQRGETPRRNTHPTVKPTELMQYLIRLVTPNGGTVLDPFNGSGSTGKAVMYENKERNKGYKYIGIDTCEEYLNISKARIEFVFGGNPTC